MADDVARLILEANTKGFADAQKQVSLVEGSLAALNASYQAGTISVSDYLREGRLLQSQLDDLKGSLGTAEAALKKYGNAADAAAALAAKASNSHRQLQQAITAGSYAFQDSVSTSGDLGAKLNSITNNLPTLLVGLGGLGTVISVAATGAVALYRNWDSLVRAFETKLPFPEATRDLSAMKDELTHAKDAMKELEQNSSLTASELEEYNRLRAETARIEKEVTAEQKKQADLQELRDARTKDDRERGQGFVEAQAGRTDRLRADIIEAMARRGERDVRDEERRMHSRIEAFARRPDTSHDDYVKFVQEQAKAFEAFKQQMSDRGNYGKTADDLLIRLKNGDKSADKILLNLMNAGTGVHIGGEGFRKAFEESRPEAKEARKAEEKRAKEEAEDAKEGMQQTHDELTDKARDLLSRVAKAGNLDESAAAGLAEIRKRGGLDLGGGKVQPLKPEEMQEFVQKKIRDILLEELGKAGLSTAGAQDAAKAMARSIAAKANEDVEKGEAKEAKDKAKAAGKVPTSKEAAKFGAAAKARDKEQKAYVDRISKTAIGLQAEAMINQYRKEGGQVGDKGELPPQVREWLARKIAQELRWQNPRMSPALAMTTGRQVANKAATGVQDRLTGLAGQGLNIQGQHMAVTEQLMGDVANLAAKTQMLGARMKRMRQGAATVSRSARKRGDN